MLEINKLSAGYGELLVLKDVSINVAPGEMVALIGPNGAGKSTVLKSVFGLTKITSGEIRYKDEKITGMPTHELLGIGVSYVPQGKINFTNLTVMENLLLGADGLNGKEALQAALTRVFSKFPVLQEKKDQLAYALSGGQQQMLAIARSLMKNPSLILFDEPSLGLSPKLVHETFSIIGSLRSEGICILIVEQNAKKAIEMADRTYLLEDGKVALEGGKEILKNPKIKKVYLGGRY
ncbi:MAG: ABC transporter ATP-binding protein [Candidatus Woesearchaeota archaeon]